MSKTGRLFLIALAWFAGAVPVLADQEASNVTHVAAGTYGRCYARSVPAYVFDPQGEPRQQGTTRVYRVAEPEDVLVQTYDWFSQRLFLVCGAVGDIVVVRVGPWQRGHDPRPDHLAIAFYRGGVLLRSYSTLDISGDEQATDFGISTYRNVSPSVSHYTVFEAGPDLARLTTNDGPVFTESWVVTARTVDGRAFVFDTATGETQ